VNDRFKTAFAAVCLLGALTGLSVSVAVSSAHAQGFSLNSYRTPPLPSDGLMLQGPGTLQAKQWSLGASLDYANDPLVLELQRGTTDSEYASIVDSQLNGHVSLAYGALDKLSVFGVMNVVMLEHGQRTPMPGVAQRVRLADGPGLGDARFGARYRLLGGRQRDSFGLGLQAAVVAPLAELADKSQNFRGESSVAGDFAVLGSFDFKVLRLGASVGTRLRKQVEFLGARLGNELTFGLGAAVPLMGDRIALLAEAQVNTELNNAFKRSGTPAELLFGVRANAWQTWRLNVGAGPGVSRGVGTPDFRMIAGVTYVAPVKEAVTIETEPETDMDPDNDDVLGVADRCPTQAEDKDNYEDQDGCPDLDNDGDGVADGTDRCATEAEDKDGFEDTDGCPDLDDDHDGIEDRQDACPRQAEDKDGFKDEDGCPDPDNDEDGIADAEDKCPTVKGDAAHQGCSSQVSITQNQIVISQRVEFALGSAELLSASDSILSAVKGALDTNPDLKIMVQGHTDNRGPEDNNLQLSKRRAVSVRTWLANHGVAAGRLSAAGCGESKPITSDNTPQGQQQNRRVEFHVVDEAQTLTQGCELAP
jgi:outer membrane protein OmpA-like peptidoglycan-associated protein